MKTVSVIIPCRNEETTIEQLLKSLLAQSYPLQQIEVVIADGLSQDGTREKIQSFRASHPQLTILLIDNPQQKIPFALNRAIRSSTGEYIIRLDAHSVPDKEYLQKCVDDLEAGKGENVGGVWIIKPSDTTWISRSIAVAAANPLGVGNAFYRYSTRQGYVDTVPFGAFKRETFDTVGFFDESLLSNEDYELNERIRKHGGKIWMDPSIRCEYFARSSLPALAKQYWRYGFWKFQMLRKYPSSIKWRQFLPPLFVTGLAVLIIGSILFKLARLALAVIIFLYISTLMVGSLPKVIKEKNPSYLIGVPLAIATMHFTWGSGFIFSLLRSLIKR